MERKTYIRHFITPAYILGAIHTTLCSCGIANPYQRHEQHLYRLHANAKKPISFEVIFVGSILMEVCSGDSLTMVSSRK